MTRRGGTEGFALELPKYHELLWPTLEVVRTLGGSGSIDEIAEKVMELEGFTEQQQAVPHGQGTQTEIEYRLAWARTYLKAVGALVNSSRGVWSITEAGRRLELEDVASIPRQVRAMQVGRVSRQDKVLQEGDESLEVERNWKEGILRVMLDLRPDRFERLAQRLLREAGFISVNVTGRSGDGGIDGIGVYRLSLVSFPVFFQCKRYRGSVGAGAVRDFRGAMTGRGDKGILITTGTFTGEAKHEATRDGAPPIDLIDGDQLCDLLRQYGLGVSTTTKQIEEVHFDPAFFQDV